MDKELNDYKDIQLFGKLFFGSELEPHNIIFDTGSSWLWVQTSKCSGCAGVSKWDPSTSATSVFSDQLVSQNLVALNYGTGGSVGLKIRDEVCLDANGTICVD